MRRTRVAVLTVVLAATATGCHQRSTTADVRAELLSGYGASVTGWSDARMDRFGHEVCTRLDANLAPINTGNPPRWIDFYSPGILSVFRNAYCSARLSPRARSSHYQPDSS
jgi:hypothetical protein